MNQVLHRPTYMVLRRGVDALLALRPHGLLEILGLVPHAINEVFPTVLPDRVNRLLILRLLGNLETFCHQFIDCRVWVNGDEIDTRMVVVTHGFYILVQLQVTAGADAVIAVEATNAIVRQGRFFHVADSPGLDILHCPGGRTLASCRTMQVTNHFDLPDVNHLKEARDQWPDLLGVALRTVHPHHAQVAPAIFRGVLLIVPAVPALELLPSVLAFTLTRGAFMGECSPNDSSLSRSCCNSLASKERAPNLRVSTTVRSYWIPRTKHMMVILSLAGSSRAHSCQKNSNVSLSPLRKNPMETSNQITPWLLPRDQVLRAKPAGRWTAGLQARG